MDESDDTETEKEEDDTDLGEMNDFGFVVDQ